MTKLKSSILNMHPGKWYPLDGDLHPEWTALIKEIFYDFDFELTFNKDFTKIKKTIWEKGRPKM